MSYLKYKGVYRRDPVREAVMGSILFSIAVIAGCIIGLCVEGDIERKWQREQSLANESARVSQQWYQFSRNKQQELRDAEERLAYWEDVYSGGILPPTTDWQTVNGDISR